METRQCGVDPRRQIVPSNKITTSNGTAAQPQPLAPQRDVLSSETTGGSCSFVGEGAREMNAIEAQAGDHPTVSGPAMMVMLWLT